MSTRGIIGTANDSGFEGRYLHWDNYPTGRGPSIMQTYEELGGDWQAVLAYAVKPNERGYWSSFAPPSEVAAQADLADKAPCNLCNATGNRTDIKLHKQNWCNGCDGTGQMSNPAKTSLWVPSPQETLVTSKDDCGAEWAYLLSEKGVTILASYLEDGGKAVGMFGSLGTDAFHWGHAGSVAWGAEAEWQKIECGENWERCIHYAWAHLPEAKDSNLGTVEWLAQAKVGA